MFAGAAVYRVVAVKISSNALYRLHMAYRKIFRFIFHLPLWAHISKLLHAFNVIPIAECIDKRNCALLSSVN